MTSICIFNPKKFYEMLSSTHNIEQSLATFRNRCQTNDIHYMFPAVNILQDVLLSNNELPLTKYNALYTAHQMLFTLSYLSVFLVEAYILPLLPPIALQFVARRSDEQLERYFIQRGFRSSAGIKLVSKRYVELAAEIVVAGANIKPKLNILHSEIQLQSKFQQAYDNLLPDVQNSRNSFSINFQSLRQGYLKRLTTFDPSNLIYFLWKTLKEQVVFNQGFSQPFKTLLQSNDFFISIPIINSCIQQLSNLPKDFAHKRQFLNLFSTYIKKGNIYAIIAAHNSTFIRDIFQEVLTVRGDISISYGKMTFAEIDASHQEKEDFYCEFLRCIQIWGLCLQTNQIGEISELKQMYDYLSKDQQFQFPNMLMLQKIISDYAQNLQLHQLENDQMLRLMDQNEHLLSQFQNFKTEDLTIIGHQRIPGTQASKTNAKASSTNPVANLRKALQYSREQRGNQSFDDLFDEVEIDFQNIPKEKSQLQSRLKHLVQFEAQWPLLKQTYGSDLPSDILRKGDELSHKIAAIKQLHFRLQKKQLSWRVFQHKVILIIHPDKNSESYIQKIKQLPFPKKNVNELSYNQKEDKEISKMEVVELQYYSKINLKQKKPDVELGVQSHAQTDADPHLEHHYLSKRLDSKIPQSKGSSQKPILKKVRYQKEPQNKQSSVKLNQKIVSIMPNEQKDKKVANPPFVDRIEPVTHNDYGIQQLLIKRRQYLQQSNQSISKNSRTIKRSQIREVQSRILPSDLLDSSQVPQKLVHSDDITSSKGENSILKKHASLRSILDRSFRRSNISHKNSSRASLSQQKTFFNDELSCKADDVEKIYQLRPQAGDASDRNESRYTEKKSAPVEPTIKPYNFQRMVYSITSRSIQAYKQYVARYNSKPKSQKKNSSTEATKSNNKSIIRKQFERLRPKQRDQRVYCIDQSSNKAISRTITPALSSDVVTYHPKEKLSRNLINSTDQLITNRSETFFPKKYDRLIKNCLHAKGMLLETNQVEVGYVHYSKAQHLDFTIFITAKQNLKSVRLSVSADDNLKVSVEVAQLTQLIKGKQEIVKILTSIKNIPFELPKLTVTAQDYDRKKDSHTLVLPCTINKYSLIEPVLQQDQAIIDKYKNGQKYRSYFLKMNKKMDKKGNITKYLPSLGHWPGYNQYVGEFMYKGESCLVGLTKDPQGSWYLWGHTLTPSTPTNILSFLMSSFFFLLEE